MIESATFLLSPSRKEPSKYSTNPNFSEDELSQIEKDNIKAILTEEQNRK